MKKQTDIYLFTNGFGRFGGFQKRTEKKDWKFHLCTAGVYTVHVIDDERAFEGKPCIAC